MCSEWRSKMCVAYPWASLLNLPNFHNVIHIFAFARKWGPPILYWTRPYEHKHKVFREFIHSGNHQDDENWCALRHTTIMSLKWLYNIGSGAPKCSISLHMEVGARIMYKHQCSCVPQYGIVQAWDDLTITVKPLTFRTHGEYHNCPVFAQSILEPTIQVPRVMYIGIAFRCYH